MAAIRLDHLRFGMRDSCVGVFQTALKNKGFNPGPIDNHYGTLTRDACRRFQLAQGWSGSGADGLAGPTTVQRLGLSLISGAGDGEPAHNYTRTTYSGRTVNQRTKVMLDRAVADFGRAITLSQGSYNRGGVSASAGTHDGGGVVDINVGNLTTSQRLELVQCLRRAGFAAWLRTPAQGFSYHIHAVAIGDRELSSAARDQIQAWRNDRNGLASNGRDPYPDPYPAWTRKYR